MRWWQSRQSTTQQTTLQRMPRLRKPERFNIGPSKQETLGRRWHDVELASGVTLFHDKKTNVHLKLTKISAGNTTDLFVHVYNCRRLHHYRVYRLSTSVWHLRVVLKIELDLLTCCIDCCRIPDVTCRFPTYRVWCHTHSHTRFYIRKCGKKIIDCLLHAHDVELK